MRQSHRGAAVRGYPLTPLKTLRQRRSMLVVAIVALVALFGNAAARWVDVNWLHEGIKDHWGAWHDREDWSRLAPLPANLDRAWLNASASTMLPIAHALGESGEPGANTLQAFQAAKEKGFRLFEVDLSLDEAGRLRCHHGPEPLPAYDPASSCTLERLMPLVAAADGWLILDIKDDFVTTANQILATLRRVGHADRAIFQLYVPRDVDWFRSAALGSDLPAPIVTAYVARRSVNHLAANARRLNVAALAVPITKLPALNVNPDLPLLVYPVHTCENRHDLDHRAVQGIFTVTRADLQHCPR
jgi:hypothetical protein